MRAKTPFEFRTSSQLVEITGKKAAHLKEFVEILKNIDTSSIFYHIHHSFREHQFAKGIFTNDFAHWVKAELGEEYLAEQLANINIKDFININVLREKIVSIVTNYLNQAIEIRKASPGHEFYFCRSIGIILKTKYTAWTLEEFCKDLRKVGMRSLYYHFFEARLRLGHRTNDFSNWILLNFENGMEISNKIEALDPYLYTLDELREKIINVIQEWQHPFLRKVEKWAKSSWQTTKK